ncbi:MAG TPA: hypothetical protein VN682_22720 [Terriglobales bacterium]|nr:hypothetical protein [Terriglobales bacterium]
MRRFILGLVYLLVSYSAQSQQSRMLIDGAAIQVAGTVGLELRGNSAYVVIKPGQPYTAVFDETDHRRVQEIGLTMDGQWDALRALIGQKVTVSGAVQLEPVSPYYLNGTLIVAKSLRLASGTVLTPKRDKPVDIPASVAQFYSRVTFAPRASQRWAYKTWDSGGGLLPDSQGYLSCGLNGAGDVMNCYCPAGFAFTATGTVTDGHFANRQRPQEGFDFAQFVLDDPVHGSISEGVECTRQAHR